MEIPWFCVDLDSDGLLLSSENTQKSSTINHRSLWVISNRAIWITCRFKNTLQLCCLCIQICGLILVNIKQNKTKQKTTIVKVNYLVENIWLRLIFLKNIMLGWIVKVYSCRQKLFFFFHWGRLTWVACHINAVLQLFSLFF